MRKKVIALSFGLLFFGSMATTTIAATLQLGDKTSVVDDDKDKNKKKAKTSENKTKECKTEKSCCKSEMYEKSSCDDKKKGGDKK